ncbi:MAG: hypothetical protein V9H25_03400 [Candidatus Competibacter sp.]
MDEFGNPPPAGEFITFRLMDGPMTGYPDQGRGVFTIAGKDGNPRGRRQHLHDSAGRQFAVRCQHQLPVGVGRRIRSRG